MTGFLKRVFPPSLRRQIVRLTSWPPVRLIRFGDLRRLEPISEVWGMDRGRPVDRYYIEGFLALHSDDIAGRVLEIGNDTYTRQFGTSRVLQSDVLHVSEGDPKATIVADLTQADHVPSDAFDCVICTQTLHLIFDVQAAISSLHRILRPGGVLLATMPGISKISRYDMDRWGDYWRFTSASAQRLFEKVFQPERLEVRAHGNVFAAVSFLHGVATEELRREELDSHDPDYELLITVRAEKR